MTRTPTGSKRPAGRATPEAMLRRALLAWYRRHARDLPWRRTKDPYLVWLSEILLQQTRVEAAIPYYERFIRALPDVQALAAASPDQVLKLWEGLGYYRRAHNLHRAARQIAAGPAPGFPRSAIEWRAVPGVGPYTAGAITSIAFGERVPALDGNARRVIARLYHVRRSPEKPRTRATLTSLATKMLPARGPGDLNQALMELGARICTPKNPRCPACPARTHCRTRAAGDVHRVPIRPPRKPVPHHEIVAAAIRRNGRYLLARRRPDGMLAGLWEFPGGRALAGETHRRALERTGRELLGVEVKMGEVAGRVEHAYSHFTITLHLYHCRIATGCPSARVHSEVRWVRASDFGRYAMHAAAKKALGGL